MVYFLIQSIFNQFTLLFHKTMPILPEPRSMDINGALLHLSPEGTWPFSAPRALPGRPRAVERSSRPEGGLEVPEGQKMARCPRDEV